MDQWGSIKDGWQYADKKQAGLFKELASDHGFMITEITGIYIFIFVFK